MKKYLIAALLILTIGCSEAASPYDKEKPKGSTVTAEFVLEVIDPESGRKIRVLRFEDADAGTLCYLELAHKDSIVRSLSCVKIGSGTYLGRTENK